MPSFDPTRCLYACRHGESLGNIARADAEKRGLAEVVCAYRDADLPLTATGHAQAAWLGRRLAQLPPAQRPVRLICSPYRRALETADAIIRHAYANSRVAFSLDARLRPKAFGVLEGLTRRGVRERFPELAAERERVGRFHFRPPGGESRADVVQRVGDFLAQLRSRHGGEPVLLVTHQIVVNAVGHLLLDDEGDALATDDDGWVPNARLYAFGAAPVPAAQEVEAA
ncbi:histidine phosphatase family protein [Tahibacter harae]|uniref:Histidine phosphatase family protein n=1 Tax=Tahibacter harae TaxID=2963937 RepID=A0ABT1QNV3_9GAMM|nr:histidine phosphatase family protein [Tahibacter harae]MCQ4163893.1 histidine phosphatase family protein [Tahibacter harae]